VPVRIIASTQIVPDIGQGKLVLRTSISWSAQDFLTNLGIKAVEDKVSEVILAKLKTPPGQVVAERGEKHIVFQSSRDIAQPKTPLFSTSLTQAQVDENGLQATGKLLVFPPPAAVFTLEKPRWSSGIDCHSRSWKTQFHPPVVHIFCPDRFYQVQIRTTPVVVPAGFWVPTFGSTGVGTGIEVRDITFQPPFPMNPAGLTSSAYLDTNVGVRWVDFGAVPVKPVQQDNPLGLKAAAISECMAISDRWGMGILNLGWLVDGPDFDLGLSHLREWTIMADGIVDVARIELAAVGPRGERRLAYLPVEAGAVVAQVITAADEALQVQNGVSLLAAPPQVLQRWIVPWLSVPVEPGTRPLALSDSTLWVAEGAKLAQLELRGYEPLKDGAETGLNFRHTEAVGLPLALAARLKRFREGNHTLPQTITHGRTVAVLHQGAIMVGLAGPLIQATGAASPEQATAKPEQAADYQVTVDYN
jgi:hypothetical protein